jgi:hypothetical protein
MPPWLATTSRSIGIGVSSLEDCDIVYWPTCMSRMMHGTAEALLEVSQRAGVDVHIPSNSVGLCCGQAFSSKGFVESAIAKQSELIDALWQWSERGKRPVVLDLGSCTAFLKQTMQDLDPVRRDQLSRITILGFLAVRSILTPQLESSRKEISDRDPLRLFQPKVRLGRIDGPSGSRLRRSSPLPSRR